MAEMATPREDREGQRLAGLVADRWRGEEDEKTGTRHWRQAQPAGRGCERECRGTESTGKAGRRAGLGFDEAPGDEISLLDPAQMNRINVPHASRVASYISFRREA